LKHESGAEWLALRRRWMDDYKPDTDTFAADVERAAEARVAAEAKPGTLQRTGAGVERAGRSAAVDGGTAPAGGALPEV
jgi:hypothetical protein